MCRLYHVPSILCYALCSVCAMVCALCTRYTLRFAYCVVRSAHGNAVYSAPKIAKLQFRVLTVQCARCDVSPARTIYAHTMLTLAETWPECTVCNGWVMLLVCMSKTRFGGIIWGGVVMMHAQKFPISMYFLRVPAYLS